MNAISRIPTNDAQPIAGIGHNGAPAPTAYELAEAEVSKAYEEAALWLDGATVDSQELADGIANLLNLLRAAEKAADAAREAEKKPHLEAGRAVDALFKPLLEKTKAATTACKAALKPWLEKQEAERQAKAAEERRIADEKRAAAEAAIRARDAANLEQAAAAEALLKDAKKADADAAAARAEKATAGAGGSVGRKAGLRTSYRPEITDHTAFARHIWANHRSEMDDFLGGLAKRLVDGGARSLPGVTVHTETKVV